MNLQQVLKNKKILVTGNTGFKGSWLSLCLIKFNSKVFGFSDRIKTNPSLYVALKLNTKIKQFWGDITDYKQLNKIFVKVKPDIVFHLAAESLVFDAYDNPLKTFKTNIIGTANIVDLIYKHKIKSSVIITSDKVYENLELTRGYVENDRLMGIDPYSASKSCAEIVINSYNKSYGKNNINICTVRAGNVIGGGDWSKNRIVPDLIKSWKKKKILKIRSPKSVRPWQHVLEPISAYLKLSVILFKNKKKINHECFNIGPRKGNKKTVEELLNLFNKKIDFKFKILKKNQKYESKLLILNSKKILNFINWKSQLTFKNTVFQTAEWYLKFYKNKKKIYSYSLNQIEKYFSTDEKKNC